MSCSWRTLISFTGLTLAAWSLSGCGGAFRSDDGSAGTGGQAGGSGSGSGGRAGSGGSSCQYEGTVYTNGESFPAGDGCNTCGCNDGEVGCTQIGCTPQCFYEGSYYQSGDMFLAVDGCNNCSCSAEGFVSCTERGCSECQEAATTYGAAIDEAKRCDPQQTGQCSKVIAEGLSCGCETFVNPANAEAIAAVQDAQEQYLAFSCGGNVSCGACLPPSGVRCSAAGRCEPVGDTGAGAACQVNGVVYESGASGIPDPVSCNTCECINGQLACTEIYCPSECPPGSAYGTQCVHCGPADGCEVFEHGCLPVCDGPCGSGLCVGGLCKSVCG